MKAMGDWSQQFRASYRYVRVNRATGEETSVLHNILSGGSIERNLDTDIKESGSINVAGRLNIGGDLLRIYLMASFIDGSQETVCLGTFLPAIQRASLGVGVESQSVDLSGRLQELADMGFVEPFQVKAGSRLVDEAKALVEKAGLTVLADESDYTTSEALTYGVQAGVQPETATAGDDQLTGDQTYLTVVNDLLQRAGFDTARTDPQGRVLLRRSTPIADRSVAWRFQEGSNARFLAEFEDNTELAGIANVFYAVYTGSKDDDTSQTVVTVGKAVDDSPTSPWSTVTLGREITSRTNYQEYATQAQANSEAQRLLQVNRENTRTITLSHVYQPVTISDAVLVDYPSAGIPTTTWGVRKQSLSLTPGCLTESEMRNAAQ